MFFNCFQILHFLLQNWKSNFKERLRNIREAEMVFTLCKQNWSMAIQLGSRNHLIIHYGLILWLVNGILVGLLIWVQWQVEFLDLKQKTIGLKIFLVGNMEMEPVLGQMLEVILSLKTTLMVSQKYISIMLECFSNIQFIVNSRWGLNNQLNSYQFHKMIFIIANWAQREM